MLCRNKECKRNKKSAPSTDFSRDSKSPTGYRRICKECDSRKRQERRRRQGADSVESVDILNTEEEVFTTDDVVRLANLNGDWCLDSVRVKATSTPNGTKIERVIKLTPKVEPEPLPDFPIKQISIPLPMKRKIPVDTRSTKLAIGIPDIHFGYKIIDGTLIPFHDRDALGVVLDACRILQPDVIVMHGDNLDMPDWSIQFLKEPAFCGLTNLANAECVWWLMQLRAACPHAEIVWLEGNHEFRIQKQILTQLSLAYSLVRVGEDTPVLSIPHLLRLDDIDVKYLGYGSIPGEKYPDSEYWYNKNLMSRHGNIARSKSLKTVEAVLQYENRSSLQGHIHRVEQASITRGHFDKSKTYSCSSMGTLADLDGPIPRVKKESNWQNGFAVIPFEEGDGLFQVYLNQIFGGKCVLINGSERYVLDGSEAYDYNQIVDEALRPAAKNSPVIMEF